MSLEAGIVERLKAVSAVTSLVSTRIYANILPDNTTHPAIVYQLISTLPFSSLNDDTGKLRSRIQFTIISSTTAQRIQLSDAIKTALQRYKGSVSDITILDSRLENISDQAYNLEANQTARIADFLIIYE